MKKTFFIISFIFLTSCATVSDRRPSPEVLSSSYIDIESFCKKHHLEYSLDTVDDTLRLYSPDKEIKLLLNSTVCLYNGSIFYLRRHPIYFKGAIILPIRLERLITSRQITRLKPLFAIKTIVVDPGHGGKDPGAISPRGVQEKFINLQISKYLREKLQKKGFKVILTRSSDTFLSLEQRVEFARRNNADLFVSIHANANRSRKISGLEIYYLSPLKLGSRERSLKLARGSGLGDRATPFDAKAILWDLLLSKNYTFSVELSNVFYVTFKNLGLKVRSPRQASFYVLRYAYVPSVLIETGYLTNAYEEKALQKKHYQNQIADAIVLAISSLHRRHSSSLSNKRYVGLPEAH